jgi:sugar phosphate isomerase/epimerase
MNNKASNLLIVLLIAAAFVPMSCTKSTKKNIGLQLYSLRDSMKTDAGVLKAVEFVGKTGYSFVEPAGYGDGKFYNMAPADFKALVEKNGMTIISSHTGQPVPDSTKWDSVMAWWDVCIAAHAELGVRYIVQPFMDSIGYQSIAGLQRYCDYFNAVGEKCIAKGIKFGYHNHSEEFKQIDSLVIYDYMITHTDSSKVTFEMDLYWAQEGGADIIAYFNKYPKRFELWHVKDVKEVGASGTMDFKTIFANAELSGMKYPVVECEEYTVGPFPGVAQSFDYLNKAEFVK